MDDHKTGTGDCGCCAGTDVETPRRIRNAPGLPEISYRVGTHGHFKESLLARLSSFDYPALGELGIRDDGDFTIALCDAVATTLDVLTFYQERIANENYLRTATERRSVLELSRLIGYEPSPGVAASTYLAFRLQEAPGDTSKSAKPVPLPVGLKVQSVPGPDEKPQLFETVESGEARAEWNDVPVRSSVPFAPAYRDTDLYVEGVATPLDPGDVILLVGEDRRTIDAGSERWEVRVLHTVERDTENDRTRIVWTTPIGHGSPFVKPPDEAVELFVFRKRAALFGHNAPDPRLMQFKGTDLESLTDGTGINRVWKREIDPDALDLDQAYPKVIAGSWIALVSNEEGLGTESLPGYVELYRVEEVRQRSRADYGLSGKVTTITPDTPEHLTKDRFEIPDTLVLAESEELTPVARPLLYPVYGKRVELSTRVEGLEDDQALAVRGKRPRVVVAPAVNDLKLVLDAGGSVNLSEGDSLLLLAGPNQVVGTTVVALEPSEFGGKLGKAAVRLQLRLEDRDGRRGTLTADADEIRLGASEKDDPEIMEIVFLDEVADPGPNDRDYTTLDLTASLDNCYDRATARINGNVVAATHGETVEEIVGSGDAGQPDQRFALRQSPLTYVSADTPSGRASTVSLRVNGLLWKELPTLFEQNPDERAYTIRVDDDGETAIGLGDGIEGARAPSGQSNVRAVYRKGLGVGGNVGAGTLTTLLSRPLGVSEVVNPEVATGGADREPLSEARSNAPLTVLTLERAVSVKDYGDFARAFAGISKAHALWIPAGPARGVLLTVAGIAGAPVSAGSKTHGSLLSALRKYGDPLVPLRLVSYTPVDFRTRIAVTVAPEFDSDTVLADVGTELADQFGFDARAFGQGTSLDEVMAIAHEVAGVVAVKVIELYRPGTGVLPTREQRLAASLPTPSLTAIPGPAELLTVAKGGVAVEVLT